MSRMRTTIASCLWYGPATVTYIVHLRRSSRHLMQLLSCVTFELARYLVSIVLRSSLSRTVTISYKRRNGIRSIQASGKSRRGSRTPTIPVVVFNPELSQLYNKCTFAVDKINSASSSPPKPEGSPSNRWQRTPRGP